MSSGTPNYNSLQADPQTRLELNLGIMAASIATLRPLFAGLEQSMVLLPSDNAQGRYRSDQPLVGHTKAGRKPTGILLSPMHITNRTDIEISRDFDPRLASGERV